MGDNKNIKDTITEKVDTLLDTFYKWTDGKLTYKEDKERTDEENVIMKNLFEDTEIYNYLPMTVKRDLWGYWSNSGIEKKERELSKLEGYETKIVGKNNKINRFPKAILNDVYRINKEWETEQIEYDKNGNIVKSPELHDTFEYGFKMKFMMFMENWEEDYAKKYFKVDYTNYQVLYTRALKT